MKTISRTCNWKHRLSRMTLGGVLLLASLGAGCQPAPKQLDPDGILLSRLETRPKSRSLVLENGISVLLISDSQAEKSGAAMAVASGSMEDPAGTPGMSHYLEHLLFLGTSRYPDPGEYQSFLTRHAGSSNAYTDDDLTNYFFDVEHGAFDGALDRFSRFFYQPLFNAGYMTREISAVDNEHRKNLASDMWRTRQIQRNLYREGHPANRFSTGTRQTLSGVTREQMLRFYQSHYSANLMTLALVGPQTLDELEAKAKTYFSAVPNRRLKRPVYPEDLLDGKPVLRMATVEPVADVRTMTLEFALPPVLQQYKSKPLYLIAFVLGHEGKGSLLSVLKKKNLATGLFAGPGQSTRSYASFMIGVNLTPQGLARHQEVLRDVMGAIRGLEKQGIPPYIYQESRVMALLDKRYSQRGSSSGLASRLSADMQDYPLDALPDDVYLYSQFRPDLNHKYLAAMTPDHMLVTLTAKGVPTQKVERYYQAKYGYSEESGQVYEALVQAPPPEGMTLPDPNPYISDAVVVKRPEGPVTLGKSGLVRLRLVGMTQDDLAKMEPLSETHFPNLHVLQKVVLETLGPEGKERWMADILRAIQPVPIQLMDGRHGRVWYTGDWTFRQPKATVTFRVITPGLYNSPRQAMLAEMYVRSQAESMNEYAYPLRMAGMDFALDAGKRSIQWQVGGYSPKLMALSRQLAGRLKQVVLTEEAFQRIKEQAKRDFENRKYAQPYAQAQAAWNLNLEVPAFSPEAMAKELPGITLADVQSFAAELFHQGYLEGTAAGNISAESVRRTAWDVYRELVGLSSQALLPENQRPQTLLKDIPPGTMSYGDSLPVGDSVVYLTNQAGEYTPRRAAVLNLLSGMMEDAFYEDMRTRQGLGYIVWAGAYRRKDMLYVDFLVQSGTHPPGVLRERMERFMPGFAAKLPSLPAPVFDRYREAARVLLSQRARNSMEAAAQLDAMAFQYHEDFQRLDRQLEELNTLTREESARYLQSVLVGASRRRLEIHMAGKNRLLGPLPGKRIIPGQTWGTPVQPSAVQ
ncbi:MAG: insulinase family protein [Deltaproteobacteria bacterium]|nr:insulinase family protein [Deltaproteobacteria bacterium]